MFEHPGKFNQRQLQYVAQHSSHAASRIFEACPFCTAAPFDLETHIANHLRDLALQFLPWSQDNEGSAESRSDAPGDDVTADTPTECSGTNSIDTEELIFEDHIDRDHKLWVEPGTRQQEYGFIKGIDYQHRGARLTLLERELNGFKAHLTPVEQNSFTGTTLGDVRLTVASIQETQISERTNRNVARLRKFLEAVESYSKVLDVFVNINDFVAFVWGPVKYLLLVSMPSVACPEVHVLRTALRQINSMRQVIIRRCDRSIMYSERHL